jgi:hypothetical protein
MKVESQKLMKVESEKLKAKSAKSGSSLAFSFRLSALS